jgi:hypothetical protein
MVDDVTAPHPPQCVVVAGLDGQVDVLAHPGQVGDRVDEVTAEVARVAGQEPDALEARHLVVQHAQEVAEQDPRPQVASVALDDLAQQHHFAGAPIDQPLDLVHDDRRRPAALAAAGARHDAVRAVPIAALVDGHAFRDARDAHRLLGVEPIPLRQVEQVDQPVAYRQVLAWFCDQVDKRIALAPIGDVAHAAGDDHLHLRPLRLEPLEVVQLPVHAVLRALAHHARVQHHHVRLGRRCRRLEPVALQTLGQPPRVGHVHLAPDGPDMKSAHRQGAEL